MCSRRPALTDGTRNHGELVTEPFLVMELDTLTKQGACSTESASLFRASMIELGLLGLLVVALVFSITLLRRYPTVAKEVKD